MFSFFIIYPKTIAIAIAFPTDAKLALELIYVVILEAATFLLVPPAPSSTINKSASAKPAPISVPPSISNAVRGVVPAVILAPDRTGA